MDYGILLLPGADCRGVVQRAEALGYSHAWVADTQLLCADVFVAMATAAVATSRIRLGTGVLVPSNRIAAVTANAMASLNKLAPGRIDFGVGTGFTARRSMGMKPIKLADLREYVRVVYELLGNRRVETRLEGQQRTIGFLNPDLGLIDIEHEIALHVSAMGPRSRRLVAEMGAAWCNFWANARGAVADAEDMRHAWTSAGRDVGGLYATMFAGGRVLAEGEPYDSPLAKLQAGPQAILGLHAFADSAVTPPRLAPLLEEYRPIYETYQPSDARYLTLHRGHMMFVRPEEERFITAELVRGLSLTGTRDELVDHVRALEAAGYRQLVINVPPGQETVLEDWRRVFEKV